MWGEAATVALGFRGGSPLRPPDATCQALPHSPAKGVTRIRVGGWLAGVERHEHDACNGTMAWHIHIDSCRTIVWCGPRPRLHREARCLK